MTMKSIALASLMLAGCQLLAPLPDLEGDGARGGGGGAGTGGDGSGGDGTGSSSVGAGGVDPGLQCGSDTCTAFCGPLTQTCETHPQYESGAACCAVCDFAQGAGLSCRPLPASDDANGCATAGPLGPSEGANNCPTGCYAACSLLAALCPGEGGEFNKCLEDCGKHPTSTPYTTCADAPKGSATCIMQQLGRAAVATGPDLMARCHDARDGHCAPCN